MQDIFSKNSRIFCLRWRFNSIFWRHSLYILLYLYYNTLFCGMRRQDRCICAECWNDMKQLLYVLRLDSCYSVEFTNLERIWGRDWTACTHLTLCLRCFLLQFSVSFPWTQTQQPQISCCQKTTDMQHLWKKSSRILITQTGSSIGLRCWLQKEWLGAVTGRLSGRERLTLVWPIAERGRAGMTMIAAWDAPPSPGVSSSLLRVALHGTITTPPTFHKHPFALAGWGSIWTGPLALCHSTRSPTLGSEPRSTSTPSTQHSLSHSSPHLVLNACVTLEQSCGS